MAGNSYTAWEGSEQFLEGLRSNRAQLEQFMSAQSPEQKQQMASGLAAYMTQAIERDPNDLPAGLSETLDDFREGRGKGGKITSALKGIKNDFYNLFDKHPNVMLTTGGIVGLGGGLSLLKHYGLDQGTAGGKITSIGNMIFQTEKAVTLSTGPFKKKLDAQDDSLSGKLAAALDGKLPEGGLVPEGMDPNSPEGKMVAESGKAVSGAFQNMVEHREMLISNILVAGETFQTGGFVTNAYLDKEHINAISPESHKAEKRTAKGGMVNAVSNTMLMGLTYYNRYIDPKVQELDENSPTYKEDRKKVWDEAPKEHMFKAGRVCAKMIDVAPQKVREMIPNTAIGASFLPLTGIVMEGMKGGKDGGIAPFQLFGALAVMANVVVNYTAITNRSKGQKVMSPEEIGQFADVVGEASKSQQSADEPTKRDEMTALKDTLFARSFVAPEHEGLIEQKLSQHFDLPFTAVRDHSRKMPASSEPAILASDHSVSQAVQSLGATEADITPEGLSMVFDQAPEATQKAVDAMNQLAQSGESHTAKSLGAMQSQKTPDGRVQLTMQVRALPAVTQATQKLAEQPDLASMSAEAVQTIVKEALQIPQKAMPMAQQQQRAPQAGMQP